jgi:hypothetical protein
MLLKKSRAAEAIRRHRVCDHARSYALAAMDARRRRREMVAIAMMVMARGVYA